MINEIHGSSSDRKGVPEYCQEIQNADLWQKKGAGSTAKKIRSAICGRKRAPRILPEIAKSWFAAEEVNEVQPGVKPTGCMSACRRAFIVNRHDC